MHFSHLTVDTMSFKIAKNGVVVANAKNIARMAQNGGMIERIDGHYILRRDKSGDTKIAVTLPCQLDWQASEGLTMALR